MDAKVYLANYSAKIEPFIEDFFSQKTKEAAKIDLVAAKALKNLKDYISGGKKVRPALTALGYQLAGGKNLVNIIPASFAVELMHNALIIHDDFVDNDELRRGKPTLHTLYSQGKDSHYGASMAIISADVGIFLANKILADSNFPPEKIIQAISAFNQFLLNTGYGELLDIAFDYRSKISWSEVLKVRIYKTAFYTFVMPLTVGAILGGASKKTIQEVEKHSLNVGLAFQLRDDVLGVFGDEKVTGKSSDSDIREGKMTLLYSQTLKMARGKERLFLKKWYGKKNLNQERIKKIKAIIKNTGALESSDQEAREYVAKGKKFIARITSDPDLAETLSTFADYMISRDK